MAMLVDVRGGRLASAPRDQRADLKAIRRQAIAPVIRAIPMKT
jgi:hypothetical protein